MTRATTSKRDRRLARNVKRALEPRGVSTAGEITKVASANVMSRSPSRARARARRSVEGK